MPHLDGPQSLTRLCRCLVEPKEETVLGHKTVRKGLWNRLTMQGGVDPMLALAISYACYPSPSQPHSLPAAGQRPGSLEGD